MAVPRPGKYISPPFTPPCASSQNVPNDAKHRGGRAPLRIASKQAARAAREPCVDRPFAQQAPLSLHLALVLGKLRPLLKASYLPDPSLWPSNSTALHARSWPARFATGLPMRQESAVVTQHLEHLPHSVPLSRINGLVLVLNTPKGLVPLHFLFPYHISVLTCFSCILTFPSSPRNPPPGARSYILFTASVSTAQS
jgi:hypothetical protein